MHLQLEGCSNPGFSLTEVRKEQILELSSWVYNHIEDDKKTYKQIQNEIETSCKNLDGSKVRMLVPFLRKMGCVENEGFEHKNEFISVSQFFTPLGKCFVEYLRLSKKISELNCGNINNKMIEIDKLFNIVNMINLISNGEEIYLECIRFLKFFFL